MKIIIVGAGVAGLWLCSRLCKEHEIILIEKNNIIGKKLLMTGNGRCNLTNNCEIDKFVEKCTGETKALFSWLYSFGPDEIMSFFKSKGIALKEEQDGKIFPKSDRAKDILNALMTNENNAKIIKNMAVKDILVEEAGDSKKRATGVILETGETIFSDAVIVATGGRSMPDTGSSGDGYDWFCKHGHRMDEVYPLESSWISNAEPVAGRKLQGVSFNGSVKFMNKTYKGEFLITHYGFSGPTILDLGGEMHKNAPQTVKFNFSEMSIDELEKLFEKNPESTLSDLLKGIVSHKLSREIMKKYRADNEKIFSSKWGKFDKKKRREILESIASYDVKIDGVRGFRHAFVTGGGLKIKDFNVKTLESKYVDNLYAAGEILNVHGNLGGYNITICISQAEAIARNITIAKI